MDASFDEQINSPSTATHDDTMDADQQSDDGQDPTAPVAASLEYVTIQHIGGPRQGFEVDSKIPNDFVKKIGIIANNLIEDELRLNLLNELKPLQSAVNNYRLASVLGRGDGKIHDLIDPSLTGGYQHWIPSEFDMKQKCFASFINNLSYFKYGERLYPIIASVFNSMIPLFEWVTSQRLSTLDRLQCIVKMQDYQLKEGEKYEGRFHKEGVDEERIIAVGIYYFDISSTMNGGELSLQTEVVSGCGGSRSMRAWDTESMKQGQCIVFKNGNDICHRVKSLSGSGTRKILVFFLIDPRHRITSSADVRVNWDDVTIIVLNHWKRNDFDLCMVASDEIDQLIANYAVNTESIRPQRMKIFQRMEMENRLNSLQSKSIFSMMVSD